MSTVKIVGNELMIPVIAICLEAVASRFELFPLSPIFKLSVVSRNIKREIDSMMHDLHALNMPGIYESVEKTIRDGVNSFLVFHDREGRLINVVLILETVHHGWWIEIPFRDIIKFLIFSMVDGKPPENYVERKKSYADDVEAILGDVKERMLGDEIFLKMEENT